MSRIALYTFGVLKAPTGSEVLKDFVRLAPSVFASAGEIDGFFGHAGAARPDLAGKAKLYEDFGSWGVAVAPRFYKPFARPGAEKMIATLSLWRDVEVARQFTFGGLHRGALQRRSEWFRKGEWPGYVLWWVSDEETPTWAEGARKLETLFDHGPGTEGFTFTATHDPAGQRITSRN